MALPQVNNSRYEVVIPSTGQKVSYRPYLVKEEKVLMMAMESNDTKQIMNATIDIIKSCVYDDIDVDKLAMFDIETLFIALRAKSVGERIDLSVKCDECDARNEITVDFDEIEHPVVEEGNTVVMVTDDVGITLRYPSYADVSLVGDTESIEGALQMIISCIVNIFDNEGVYDARNETKKSLQDFVESLNNSQFLKLSEFFAESPSLRSDIEFDCVSCKTHNKQELRGLQSFFT